MRQRQQRSADQDNAQFELDGVERAGRYGESTGAGCYSGAFVSPGGDGFSHMLEQQQKRYLKALVHARKPVVIIGAQGLTPAALAAIDEALQRHELIKVRVNAADRDARDAMIEQICTTLQSELVQRIGHVATLFRRNPETPRVNLP